MVVVGWAAGQTRELFPVRSRCRAKSMGPGLRDVMAKAEEP